MLRSQLFPQILAPGFLFAFRGGRDLRGVCVYRNSIFRLLLPVFLLSLTRNKFGHGS